jgi:hypothetical protein
VNEVPLPPYSDCRSARSRLPYWRLEKRAPKQELYIKLPMYNLMHELLWGSIIILSFSCSWSHDLFVTQNSIKVLLETSPLSPLELDSSVTFVSSQSYYIMADHITSKLNPDTHLILVCNLSTPSAAVVLTINRTNPYFAFLSSFYARTSKSPTLM